MIDGIMRGMNKLQWRLNRDDAELTARALHYYAKYSNDAPIPDRAEGLAKWLDHRIARFWSEAKQEPTVSEMLQERKRLTTASLKATGRTP